jgi:hypothetical protein
MVKMGGSSKYDILPGAGGIRGCGLASRDP